MQYLLNRIRTLFSFDLLYGSFWLALIILLFFFPVVIGWQSLTEAVPTFYSQPSPDPNVKTLWQVDGGWHTLDVIPLVKSEIAMVKKGVPPLWTPYSGGGEAPIPNNPVNIYYPLRFIFSFLWDSTRAFDWYFLLRFFITGLGTFLYLRFLDLRKSVALWGGIAYMFCGYLMLYLTFSFLDIESLLPWTLLSIEYFFRTRSAARAALIGILFSFIILVGQPQSAIIAFLFLLLYFGWKATRQTASRKDWWILVGHATIVIAVACAIASPFIIDFLINWKQGGTIAAWVSKGLTSFAPIQLLHFLITPTMMPEVAASGHLFDRYEVIIPYVGVSVILLFLVSLFLKKKPFPLFPLYAWIGFIILKNAGFPIVHWIGTLPILQQIGWYKAYGSLALAIVICASIAFEHMLRERERGELVRWRKFYTLIATIPVLFAGAYAFFKSAFLATYVPNFDFFNRRPEMIKKVVALTESWPRVLQEFVLGIMQDHGEYLTLVLFAEAIFFGGLALAIFFLAQKKQRYAVHALLILTAFELWFYMPKVRDGFRYLDPYAQTPPYVQFLQSEYSKKGVARTFSVGNVFAGHLGDVYRIQRSQNNSVIKPQRYFSFLPQPILEENPIDGLWPASRLSEIPKNFLDAYNIRYLISEQELPASRDFRLIYDRDLRIYENLGVLPKAYVVFNTRSASSPSEARRIFYEPSFDPRVSVILEDENVLSLVPRAATENLVAATVLEYKENEVVLRSETDRDGVLVLTDTFYSGWNAYIDGERTSIYPANVLFRGVFLPRGEHIVVFRYKPWWFWPSIAVSLACLIGAIGSFAYPALRNTIASPANAEYPRKS
ncbi:hypothetical protein C4571_01370 [Candidatus Parcubacteria bacterium]|nr:MAG: hypothetical protein C4571_01370 [Candidatus Parcubacteria bacterium]